MWMTWAAGLHVLALANVMGILCEAAGTLEHWCIAACPVSLLHSCLPACSLAINVHPGNPSMADAHYSHQDIRERFTCIRDARIIERAWTEAYNSGGHQQAFSPLGRTLSTSYG
jgi:hypothetical protein